MVEPRGHSIALLSVAVLAAAAGSARAAGDSDALAGEDPDSFSQLVETARDAITPSIDSEFEWALGTHGGNAQKAEVVLDPEVEIRLPFDALLTTIGRLRVDGYDRLEPGTPPQRSVSDVSRREFVGDHVDFELREFFLEARAGALDVTLGKQQIVWGEADGLKVLDVVNPQSFREFILDDFEDSRIPLWAAKVEAPLGFADATLEVVWIPDRTYHIFPELDSGALYEFTTPRLLPAPPAGLAVDVRDPERPHRFFEDSDIGGRVSGFAAGWDLTFNYLYHYDDIPVLFTRLDASRGTPTLVVSPRYRRTHLIGGTFTNAFGDLTVRGELGYSTSKFFSVTDPGDHDGVTETGEFSYVLGGDWYGFRDTLISVQLFQSVLSDNPRGLFRDPVDTSLTLFVTRTLLNDSLELQGMWLYNINDGDGLIRTKVIYELTDHVDLWVGGDIFYGSRFGLFGEFDANDRVVAGFRVGF